MSRNRTIPRTCLTCGKDFLTWKSKAKMGLGKYCSHSCAAKNHTGKTNPNWKGGKIFCVCLTCGKAFLACKDRVDRGWGRYCSKGCANTGTRMGEANLNWKHGKYATPQQRAHGAVHRAIKRGELRPRPCELCGTTIKVDSHHEDYSKPLDVRWLCESCHAKEHVRIRNIRGR